MRRWIALTALLPAAFLAGRLSFAEDQPSPQVKTVRGLRYRILWADSALDLGHGGGQWVQEIYLPEKKVACALVFEPPSCLAKPAARLYAYPADRPRNDLTGLQNPKPSTIEEVVVPTEVAEEIVRLAELTQKQQREAWRLGRKIAAQGLLRELPA